MNSYSLKIFWGCLIVFISQPLLGQKPLPTFSNLDFTEYCPQQETGLCNWEVSYLYEGTIGLSPDTATLDRQLCINNVEGVGFTEQVMPLPPTEDFLLVKFSAWVETYDLEGKGAGLNISVHDAAGEYLQIADMGYRDYNFVRGSRGKRMSLQVVVPPEATSVKIGLISYGSGQACFRKLTARFTKPPGTKASEEARAYLSAVLDTIRRYSLRRDSVNIEELGNRAMELAKGAKTAEDLYPTVRYLLRSLGDHHSFLMTAKDRRRWEGVDDTVSQPEITFSAAEQRKEFGYLHVPGFHSSDHRQETAFTDTLRRQLNSLTRRGVRGWIVDLRDNDGGNMHPMLAGLEPLFSADTLGALVWSDGRKDYWGRGTAFARKHPEEYVTATIPSSIHTGLPIAVLYGARTGSSGEAVIASFIGNANTRSFGQPSWGLTTGNEMFPLPDGAALFLAANHMADRKLRVYHGRINPDVVIEPDKDPAGDATLEAAIRWLRNFSE